MTPLPSNPPIIGKPAQAGDIHNFKKRKMLLKDLGYPTNETQHLVREYYDKVKHKFTPYLNSNCLLITVPSGSGRNMLTIYFAQALQQAFQCSILEEGLIHKTHVLEAKLALSLEKRITDPINYKIADGIKGHIPFGKKIFIVDDVIGTGESAVRLKQCLLKHSIQCEGFINLLTVENRYPSINDMNRLTDKITSKCPMQPDEKIGFSQHVHIAFNEYTRQKINRIERAITTLPKALAARDTIIKSAQLEQTLKTTLHLTPKL